MVAQEFPSWTGLNRPSRSSRRPESSRNIVERPPSRLQEFPPWTGLKRRKRRSRRQGNSRNINGGRFAVGSPSLPADPALTMVPMPMALDQSSGGAATPAEPVEDIQDITAVNADATEDAANTPLRRVRSAPALSTVLIMSMALDQGSGGPTTSAAPREDTADATEDAANMTVSLTQQVQEMRMQMQQQATSQQSLHATIQQQQATIEAMAHSMNHNAAIANDNDNTIRTFRQNMESRVSQIDSMVAQRVAAESADHSRSSAQKLERLLSWARELEWSQGSQVTKVQELQRALQRMQDQIAIQHREHSDLWRETLNADERVAALTAEVLAMAAEMQRIRRTAAPAAAAPAAPAAPPAAPPAAAAAAAAPAAAPPPVGEEVDVCVVCQNPDTSFIMAPCGHRVLCEDHAEVIMDPDTRQYDLMTLSRTRLRPDDDRSPLVPCCPLCREIGTAAQPLGLVRVRRHRM